jgi:hypothetical protein
MGHGEEAAMHMRVTMGRLAGVVGLVVMLGGVPEAVAAAQVLDWHCSEQAPVAPNDGFTSGGIGLSCDEWVARYGLPDEIGQSDVIYDIGGVQVYGMGSPSLRLQFDDTFRQRGIFPNEFQAALSFLPRDADYLGVADLTTGLFSYQTASVFYSPSLAARNAAMGFASRPGLILVVTSFAPEGIERGRVETIQVVQTTLRG